MRHCRARFRTLRPVVMPDVSNRTLPLSTCRTPDGWAVVFDALRRTVEISATEPLSSSLSKTRKVCRGIHQDLYCCDLCKLAILLRPGAPAVMGAPANASAALLPRRRCHLSRPIGPRGGNLANWNYNRRNRVNSSNARTRLSWSFPRHTPDVVLSGGRRPGWHLAAHNHGTIYARHPVGQVFALNAATNVLWTDVSTVLRKHAGLGAATSNLHLHQGEEGFHAKLSKHPPFWISLRPKATPSRPHRRIRVNFSILQGRQTVQEIPFTLRIAASTQIDEKRGIAVTSNAQLLE